MITSARPVQRSVRRQLVHHWADAPDPVKAAAAAHDPTYPPPTHTQPAQLHDFEGAADADAATSIYGMPPSVFYKLHPFHLVLDEDLNVLQVGPALRRIAPGCHLGDSLVRHFKVRPRLAWGAAALPLGSHAAVLVVLVLALLRLEGRQASLVRHFRVGAARRLQRCASLRAVLVVLAACFEESQRSGTRPCATSRCVQARLGGCSAALYILAGVLVVRTVCLLPATAAHPSKHVC